MEYFSSLARQGGVLPHLIIDDVIGIDRYRRIAACPDAESLAAYSEDRLAFELSMQIGAHIARCPLCGADVADLRELATRRPAELTAALSAWRTPFVGREAQRNRLREALGSGAARLLTVAAPAGIGKTRLALETATEQADLFSEGVCYVALAGLTEAAPAAQEIARALELPLSLRSDPVDQLRAHFGGNRILLVLDDLAPGSPAAEMVGALAERCAGLHCLSTAPRALGLTGEQVLALPPLELPDPGHSAARLLAGESVQLFAACVHTAAPDAEFDEPDVRSAAAICRRTGGTPLGIELAAARVGERSVAEVAAELEERPFVATPSGSLRELIAWSFGLLPTRQQEFLAQCSVFVDGFFAAQARAVCLDEDAEGLLAELSASGLVQRGKALGRVRYRLLEPVRAYAGERLGADTERFVRRHAAAYLAFARERAEWLEGTRYRESTEEFKVDLPNLRAGMDRSEALGEWRQTGEYAAAMRLFLYLHGLWPEGVARAEQAITAYARIGDEAGSDQAQIHLAMLHARRDAPESSEDRLREIVERAARRGDAAAEASARYGLGYLAEWHNRYSEAIAQFEAACAYFRSVGDLRRTGDALTHLGKIAWDRGELDTAETKLHEALAYHRECDSRYSLSSTLSVAANVLLEQGWLERARRLFAECLEIRRDIGDVRGQAATICNLGAVSTAQQDYEQAEICFIEAGRRADELDARSLSASVLCYYGALALELGDLRMARVRLTESLRRHEALNNAFGIAEAEGHLARVAQLEGDADRAAQLYRQCLLRLHAHHSARRAPQLFYWYGLLLASQELAARAALLLDVALACCPPNRHPLREAIVADRDRIAAHLPAANLTELEWLFASQPLEQIITLALAAPDASS
jgi:predicted ATPase